MGTQDPLARLAEWTGSLRPSSRATAADLQVARERLAACLLGGQAEDVSSAAGAGDPDRPAPWDLDPQVLAALTAALDAARAGAAREDLGRTSLRAFRRALPVLTGGVAASVPRWADGWAVDQTLGPFLGVDGRPFWFDFRRVVLQIQVVRGPGGAVVLTIPPASRPRAGDPSQYELPRGSLWIASPLLARTAPAGGFTGLPIRDGLLDFGAPPTAAAGVLQAPAGATLVLRLTLDPPAVATGPGLGPGADASAASADVPAEVTIALPPGGVGAVRAAADARLMAYGDAVALTFAAGGPLSYDPSLNRILVPFAPAPPAIQGGAGALGSVPAGGIRRDRAGGLGFAGRRAGGWARDPGPGDRRRRDRGRARRRGPDRRLAGPAAQ
jgi:hypothetical protein